MPRMGQRRAESPAAGNSSPRYVDQLMVGPRVGHGVLVGLDLQAILGVHRTAVIGSAVGRLVEGRQSSQVPAEVVDVNGVGGRVDLGEFGPKDAEGFDLREKGTISASGSTPAHRANVPRACKVFHPVASTPRTWGGGQQW